MSVSNLRVRDPRSMRDISEMRVQLEDTQSSEHTESLRSEGPTWGYAWMVPPNFSPLTGETSATWGAPRMLAPEFRRWRGASPHLRVSRGRDFRNFATGLGRVANFGYPKGGTPHSVAAGVEASVNRGVPWAAPPNISPVRRGNSGTSGAPRVIPCAISPLARGASVTWASPRVEPPEFRRWRGVPQQLRVSRSWRLAKFCRWRGVPRELRVPRGWFPDKASPLAWGTSVTKGLPSVEHPNISPLAWAAPVSWGGLWVVTPKLHCWRGVPEPLRVPHRWYLTGFRRWRRVPQQLRVPRGWFPDKTSPLARGASLS